MMIGKDFSFADDEAGAKEIGADFGSAAFGGVDGIAVAVFQGRAIGINASITEAAAGIFR